jgi:paraquat-inducible protein B
MSRRADPFLIGGFVLGALALAVAAILLMAGGELFREHRQQIMYFEGAAQGLQIGAPVMFLGVKIGTVKKIQLGLDEASGQFVVPVTVEIQPDVVHTANGEEIDLRDLDTQRRLVQRGLRARLRMQSLLTGQLYVDLDFHPDKPARFRSSDPAAQEIPTIPTPIQELTGKLESFPVDTFLADLAAIGESVRSLSSDAATRQLPRRMQETLGRIETLAARIETQLTPAMAEARRDLAELRSTLSAAGSAFRRVESAAERVASAADKVGALAAGDAKFAQGIGRASDELAGAARSLRSLTAEDAPTVQNLNAALKELARAARALRVLAETLDRHPEALIRGKKETEGRQ